MLPNRLIVRAYLSRGGRIWVAVRAMAAVAFFLGEGDALRITAGFTFQMILWSVVLGFVDVRRRHERALLGNLGVRPAILAAVFAGAAAVGEAALWLGHVTVR